MRVLIALIVMASGWDIREAAVALSGAGDISEIDVTRMEQYEALAARPVNINSDSRGRLVSCGLFSAYQIASILDWRSRYGDIASLSELSAVDGFTPALCRYLDGFITFGPDSDFLSGRRSGSLAGTLGLQPPDSSKRQKFSFDASAGVAGKASPGEVKWQYSSKVRAEWFGCKLGDIASSVALKSDWIGKIAPPQKLGYSISLSCRKIPLEIVAGCFNTRFGQGLLLWSGLVMDSYSTPSSLMKHPSAVNPYTSWSTDYANCGLAASTQFHNFSVSAMVDPRQRFAASNVSYFHRNGQVGFSALVDWPGSIGWGISTDFQETIGRFVLFGEAALRQEAGGGKTSKAEAEKLSKSVSGILGVRAQLGSLDCSLRLGASKEIHNATLALEWMSPTRRHIVDAGGSFSYHPVAKGQAPARSADLKTMANYRYLPSDKLEFKTIVKLRFRPFGEGPRQEIREDVKFSLKEGSYYVLRLNVTHSKEWGYLAGLDSKIISKQKLSLYAQAGAFRIDNWADRIYVYQHDAPGMFNIPAMYGRGLFANACLCHRTGKLVKLYSRISLTSYPWARPNDKRRASELSALIHCVISLH